MDCRIKSGNDESFRSRDAAAHPSFAYAKKSQAKKRRQETPPLKEGRRSADRRVQDPHRKGMRRASFLLSPLRKNRGRLDLMERARSPFGAPPRHPRLLASARLRPRFLEPPDANGRTLSGTSAASTSQSDTRRTGRCPSRPRAQCIAALHENRSRSASRSTLAKGVPSRAGFWLGNCNGDKSQGQCRFIRDASSRWISVISPLAGVAPDDWSGLVENEPMPTWAVQDTCSAN